MPALTKFAAWIDTAVSTANMKTDQFVVALSNTAPNASTHDELADITEISYTNCSSRNLTISSAATASGIFSLTLADLTLTASGGSVGPFRYIIIYDDTVTGDKLVGFVDRGSSLTLASGESVLLDFTGTTIDMS